MTPYAPTAASSSAMTAKAGEQSRSESGYRRRFLGDVGERACFVDHCMRLDPANRRAQSGQRCIRISARADEQRRRRR
jgi:hypothetical protein